MVILFYSENHGARTNWAFKLNVIAARSSNRPKSQDGIPIVQMFSEGNGGEWRQVYVCIIFSPKIDSFCNVLIFHFKILVSDKVKLKTRKFVIALIDLDTVNLL